MLQKILVFSLAMVFIGNPLCAQGPGRGGGRGQGFGPGGPRGPGGQRGFGPGGGMHAGDERHDEDHQVFQYLLSNHDKIRRQVTNLENGVQTVTESDDPQVAAKIKEHVEWMEVRIEETNPIRMRDPLFAEIFKHTDEIEMAHEETERGVRVTETSKNPYVVKLIQAHAKTVSGFVEHGFAEAMKNHPVPGKEAALAEPRFPKIAGYGQVVPLPQAAQQPRNGTQICVDVTGGGEPDQLIPAIEKVAKFVNIYAGGGASPAEASIAVVLHGEATLAALNSDAYAAKFGTEGNPNFELLHELHEQGVPIYVCGQSLISKGGKPEEVMVFVDVAVSALTAIVNHQLDGYTIVDLR